MTLRVDATVRRGGFEVVARFEAEAGQTVALLGPNGSGKTTLVSAIAGILPPVTGTIELDGVLLDSANDLHVTPERRPVGVVFQDLLLFPTCRPWRTSPSPSERGARRGRGRSRGRGRRWIGSVS